MIPQQVLYLIPLATLREMVEAMQTEGLRILLDLQGAMLRHDTHQATLVAGAYRHHQALLTEFQTNLEEREKRMQNT